jgi:hypothetical protein
MRHSLKPVVCRSELFSDFGNVETQASRRHVAFGAGILSTGAHMEPASGLRIAGSLRRMRNENQY